MGSSVRLKDVTHVYVNKQGATLALEGIYFSLKDGEFVSIVGPSGCGKTTLLSIMAGLFKPAGGQVEVNGSPLEGPSPHIGYMLQQDYLFPWRTIWDNALLGLELRKAITKDSKEYTLHLLEEMGLEDTLQRYPSQLSGGMRQRVALVRTLAVKPDILLLDEPFSALDYQTKLQLEDLVAMTLKKHGKTAVLVTHDISEAIAMSDRIIILDRNPGRTRREITVPEVIRKESPFLAREAEGFHPLFHTIWQEFEAIEKDAAERKGGPGP